MKRQTKMLQKGSDNMEKIIDTFYIFFILLNKYKYIIIVFLIIATLFFTIDFTIWNKTKKSLWHKIINKLK